jgi:hypothetical protein
MLRFYIVVIFKRGNMGFLDILKGKKKEELPEKRELDIPAAPPTSEELPTFPSAKEAKKPEITEEPIIKPAERPISPLERMEEAAVKEQKEVLEERDELELKRPIFIPIEQFRFIVDEMGLVKNILKENEDTLARVSEFKEDEDKEFNKWESQIKDIQKKLIYADKTLFGSKG